MAGLYARNDWHIKCIGLIQSTRSPSHRFFHPLLDDLCGVARVCDACPCGVVVNIPGY